MTRRTRNLGTGFGVAAVAAMLLAAGPASGQTAKASLLGADGKETGMATFTQTPSGVLLKVAVKGLPAVENAQRVPAHPKRQAPVNPAGRHFKPHNKKHGLMAADGHHAGDMPNLTIPQSGELTAEGLNAAITLDKGKPNSLFDADGSALVIHAGKDDYKTDPTGDAGGRIACGVIQ